MENKIWLVAYIIRNYIGTVEKDLKKHGMGDVNVYIPTVKVLRKQVKGKNIYEEIPLLFNYGFFHVPFEKACNINYITNLRKKVPCIYGWVKDTCTLMSSNQKLRTSNTDIFKPNLEGIATVSEEEIVSLLKASEYSSIFSEDAIDKIHKGSYLILKGYPYDGIPAEVIRVDKAKKVVEVKLLLQEIMHKVMVNFDNIFYTVYNDFDSDKLDVASGKVLSLDEMAGTEYKSVDKLFASISYGD